MIIKNEFRIVVGYSKYELYIYLRIPWLDDGFPVGKRNREVKPNIVSIVCIVSKIDRNISYRQILTIRYEKRYDTDDIDDTSYNN